MHSEAEVRKPPKINQNRSWKGMGGQFFYFLFYSSFVDQSVVWAWAPKKCSNYTPYPWGWGPQVLFVNKYVRIYLCVDAYKFDKNLHFSRNKTKIAYQFCSLCTKFLFDRPKNDIHIFWQIFLNSAVQETFYLLSKLCSRPTAIIIFMDIGHTGGGYSWLSLLWN